MARIQLISSLLLLVLAISLSCSDAARLRSKFARQQVAPTPYPSAAELKPEVAFEAEASDAAASEAAAAETEPALIYGPPLDADLPAEDIAPETEEEEATVDEPQLDTEEDSVEATTPLAVSARLRSQRQRQRSAKLQLAKKQSQSQRLRQRQRLARLEEIGVVAPAAPVAPIAPIAALPGPQFYFVNPQQPYAAFSAYNAAQQLQLQQQLAW